MAAPIVPVEVRGLDEPELREFSQRIFDWRRNDELSVDGYSIAEIGGGEQIAATVQVQEWHARECLFWSLRSMQPVKGLNEEDVRAIIAYVRENQRISGFEPYPPN